MDRPDQERPFTAEILKTLRPPKGRGDLGPGPPCGGNAGSWPTRPPAPHGGSGPNPAQRTCPQCLSPPGARSRRRCHGPREAGKGPGPDPGDEPAAHMRQVHTEGHGRVTWFGQANARHMLDGNTTPGHTRDPPWSGGASPRPRRAHGRGGATMRPREQRGPRLRAALRRKRSTQADTTGEEPPETGGGEPRERGGRATREGEENGDQRWTARTRINIQHRKIHNATLKTRQSCLGAGTHFTPEHT